MIDRQIHSATEFTSELTTKTRRPTAWILTILLAGPIGCHVGDSYDRCGELAQRLYEARQSGERVRIQSVLMSEFLAEKDRDSLVSAILDRDAKLGFPQSRRRYASNSTFKSDIPAGWYSVQNGYELHYTIGNSREVVVCRVEASGNRGAIVDLEIGPLPPN